MLVYFVVTIFITAALSYNINTKSVVVYAFPKNGPRSSYFGMTVALRPSANDVKNDSWVLQVGAPRSNISTLRVVEPGAVYRCGLHGPCSLTVLDGTGNVVGKKGRKDVFLEKKDNAWIGVAMDIKNSSTGDTTVVCGHRWTYQAVTNPSKITIDNYLMVGVCYVEVLDGSGKIFKLLPLRDEDRAYFLMSLRQADYDWGLGLAGISAHLAAGGLVIGAPTVYHMTGTVISYANLYRGDVADINLINNPPSIRRDFYAYNGYSVSSGKFFGDGAEWLVFGAPRSAEMHGSVFPFQFQGFYGKTGLKIHNSHVRGSSYGEYFGASLATTDINQDGFDDLIVGAPMFSRRYFDQGRVYVYLGGHTRFEESNILEGTGENGRFGTCVAAIGDMDNDGFPDIIVGAPYEYGRGAIYLFRGGLRGLNPIVAQKIVASDIHPSLKGFGVSISRGVDVDGNFYKDIAVGSYLSDSVVLLRSHPIISLNPTIAHPLFLDRKKATFDVTVCLEYTGANPPRAILLDAALFVDEELNRASVGSSGNIWLLSEATITYNIPLCKNVSITLDSKRLNGTFGEPIRFVLENHLRRDEVEGPQIVWDSTGAISRDLPPVTNVDTSKSKITVDVPFAGECGLDNECHPVLALECSFPRLVDNLFVLGSSDDLSLIIKVKNRGEPANYLKTEISIGGIPSDVTIRDSDCISFRNSVTCETDYLGEGSEDAGKGCIYACLTYPYVEGFSLRSYDLSFATTYWSIETSAKINISASASSVGSDTVHCQMELDIVSDAEVLVQPSATNAESPSSLTCVYNFSQLYEVQKSGVSPIGEIKLQVSIPVSFAGGHPFASFQDDSFGASLANEASDIDILDKEFPSETDEVVGFLTKSDIGIDKSTVFNNGTLFLNCSAFGVVCTTVTFMSSIPSFISNVPINLNLTVLDNRLKGKSVIKFTTNASLIFDHPINESVHHHAHSTSIIFLPIQSAGVNYYIIFLSLIAGLLLLSAIVQVLVKNGFFRRKKKEEMQAIMTEDLINERFSVYDFKDSTKARKFSSGSLTGQTFSVDSP